MQSGPGWVDREFRHLHVEPVGRHLNKDLLSFALLSAERLHHASQFMIVLIYEFLCGRIGFPFSSRIGAIERVVRSICVRHACDFYRWIVAQELC
jgi:hypothetical protein